MQEWPVSETCHAEDDPSPLAVALQLSLAGTPDTLMAWHRKLIAMKWDPTLTSADPGVRASGLTQSTGDCRRSLRLVPPKQPALHR